MKTTVLVDLRVKHVRSMLADEAASPGDLAAAGEELRRLLGDTDGPEARQALAEYERRMTIAPVSALELTRMIADTLMELQRFASTPLAARDFEQGDDLLRAVDVVLGLARVQREPDLRMLYDVAAAVAADLAPKLPDLWDLAEDMTLHRGPDADYPWLYEWIEPIAALSPRRLRAGDMIRHVFSSARRTVS